MWTLLPIKPSCKTRLSNTYMHTGYNSYFGSTCSLVKFYLPSLPSDSKISSANFNAYQTNTDGTSVSVDLLRTTANKIEYH